MKKFVLPFFFLMVLQVLVGCAPSNNEGFKLRKIQPQGPAQPIQPVDTEILEEPVVVEAKDISLIRGATQLKDSNIQWNGQKSSMTLVGRILVKASNTSTAQELPLQLEGLRNEKGQIILKSIEASAEKLPIGWSVGAQATCLALNENENNGEAGSSSFDCSKAVIDIFVRGPEALYQHQVEFEHKVASSPKVEVRPVEPVTVEPVKAEVKPVPVPTDPRSVPEDEEVSETEDEKQSAYQSEVSRDVVENVLKPEPVKPTPEAKPSKEQVVGSVNDGRLMNAVNMLERRQKIGDKAGFHILRPERKNYFATDDMATVIVGIGKWLHQWLRKYELIIGDISKQGGGRLGTHKSHQSGLDADIAYLFTDANYKQFQYAFVQGRLNSDLMIDKNWALFKALVSSKKVDRIFLHREVKKALCNHAIAAGELRAQDKNTLAFETFRRLIPDLQHNSHFHLRLKCPKDQKRCRQMVEPPKVSGCY